MQSFGAAIRWIFSGERGGAEKTLLSKITLQNNPIRVDVESVDGAFVRTDVPTSMIVVDEYTTIEFMGSSEYDSYMESRLTLLLEDGFVELGGDVLEQPAG